MNLSKIITDYEDVKEVIKNSSLDVRFTEPFFNKNEVEKPLNLNQLFPNIGKTHYWITEEMFYSHEKQKEIRNSEGKNLYDLTKKLYQRSVHFSVEQIRKIYLLSSILNNDATILSKINSKSAKLTRDLNYLDNFISNANLSSDENKMLNLYFSGLNNQEIGNKINNYSQTYIKDKMKIIKKKILISGISSKKDKFEDITYQKFLENPENESNPRYLRFSLRKRMDEIRRDLEIDEFYKTFKVNDYKIIRGIKKKDLFCFVYGHSPNM
jgi:hypothetical protein